MQDTQQIESIMREIKILDYRDKIDILERLVKLLKQSARPAKKHSLLELEGLGRNVWKNIDVNQYIDQERDSWI